MAFYLRFERNGEDLYPLIRKVNTENRAPDWNRVRYEILNRFGYFVTESSGHFSEYTPWFIKRDRPDLIEKYNVPNNALIDNLPQGCCVEVPILVDKNGLQPTRISALPPQLTALMQTNINVQLLTVEAALTQKREHIYHAAMLDPHTGAELSFDQIYPMVDELITAHGSYLPVYH